MSAQRSDSDTPGLSRLPHRFIYHNCMSFRSVALQSHTVDETQTFTGGSDFTAVLFWETPTKKQTWMLQEAEKWYVTEA